MALPQQHVSKRSALDYMKRAAFVLMVTYFWAGVMATAEGVNWSVLLTTVIVSTSAEAKLATRIHLYDPTIVSRIYAKETNNSKIMSKLEVEHILAENAPDGPLNIHDSLEAKTSKSSEKLLPRSQSLSKYLEKKLEVYSTPSLSSSFKEPKTTRSYPYSTALYLHSKSIDENRHSIRPRSIDPNKCPEIQENKSCSCNAFRIHCDGLNITVLTFLEPLSVDVKHVSAARNHLHSIPVISGASNLLELSLAQNEIKEADMKHLLNFTKLGELDLSANKLEKLDLSEGSFSNLLKLNVSFNKLVLLESRPLSLTHLHLQNNIISDVMFVSRFRSLKYLNLSFNQISHIPADIFQNLTDLYLLDLKNNQLTNADFVQFTTKVLHTLILSNNIISSFPSKSFRGSKIVELCLDNNTLTNVDFLIYSNAAEINLNDNQLIAINGKLFENKRKLKVLNVSGMKLTSMDFITNIPSLVSFGMESNNISCLPKAFLKKYETLKEWFLLDNPLEDLICSMSSEWSTTEMCNFNVSNSIVQIHMKDENINDIMRCVLDHRNIFEDCEQKCNFASHTLFPPLLIFISMLYNIIL